MKSFKRILVLALAVAMCLTAFAISSSAAGEFNPSAQLLARYNENGDKIIVSITTNVKCGAMMATLTYPTDKGIALSEDTGRFIEDATNKTGEFFDKTTAGKVKFAVVTDDVTVGSTHWADICFDINIDNFKTDVNFTLEDIQVCDINETLDESVAVNAESVTFAYKALRGLGAQKATAGTTLRFGTRVDFAGGDATNVVAANQITIDGKAYSARRCGYSLAYTNNVEGNFDNFGVQLVNAANSMELVAKDATTTIFAQATKYYKNDPAGNFFVYTLAVTGLNKDRSVSVRPYVIYEGEEGGFVVINGDVLTNSCTGVANALTYIGDLGTNYYE